LSGVDAITKVLSTVVARTIQGARDTGSILVKFYEESTTVIRQAVKNVLQGDKETASALGKIEKAGESLGKKFLAGEPVDVVTGDVVMSQVDVELPGTLPLVLERAHRSGQRTGRWLGASWMSTLDQRLVVTPDAVCFAAQDASVLVYERPWLAGEPVWPVSGERWPLAREGDAYTVTDPRTGVTRRFEPRPGYDIAPDGTGVLPLVLSTSRAGHQITFEYGSDGAPVSVSHNGGYQIRVAADGERVTGLSLAGAADGGEDVPLVSYGYDEAGNLAEVVDSTGSPLVFSYDDEGRLTEWVNPNGWWYRYHYDEQGRCVRGEGPDGMLSDSFAYDPEQQITRHTDATGGVTVYQLTEDYRVAAVTDPLGHVTSCDYDSHGELVSQADMLGRVTRLARDRAGNLTAITRPDGSQVTCVYDEQSLPVLVTEPDGTVWQRQYDEHGCLTRVTGPDGATTSYSYDQLGNLASVTDPLGAVTLVQCNPAGLPVAVTAPDGATAWYQRDGFGRVTAVSDPDGRLARLAWTTEGLLASRVFPDGTAEYYAYDGEQNLVKYTDAAGGVTRFEYGCMDQRTARIGPDGTRTDYGYDQAMRLTSVTRAGLTWRYEHDLAGRLTAQTDYNGATTSYSYDAAGQVTSQTNAAGQQLSYAYDQLGRVTEQHAAGVVSTFSYDPAGRLARAQSPHALVEMDYDAAGRLTVERINGAAVRSEYDAAGRRVRRITPSGVETRWEYDTAGRPAVLATAGQELRFAYALAGQETRRLLPGGAALAQEWSTAGQLTAQVLTAPALPGAAPEAPSAILSRLGSPAPAAGPGPGRVLQRRRYTYRDDGPLTGMDDLLSGLRQFTLDQAARVTGVTGPGWTESYGYDRAGNISTASWPALPGEAARMPPVGRPEPGDQGSREYSGTLIRRAGDVRYEHDAAGRVTLRQHARLSRKPDTWRYEWDCEDRLTAVTVPDGTRWHYTYDPLGRRIAKYRVGPAGHVSRQTTFTWDGPLLAEQASPRGEYPADAQVTTWDYQPGTFTPLTQAEHWLNAPQDQVDQAFYAIITDLIGTPAELVSSGGDLAGHLERTLWGTSAWTGRASTPLRFPGQYHDDETGLHYNCQRYYDPATGRYLSPDPLGLAPGPNPHAYVANPAILTDPLGLAPTSTSCSSGLRRTAADVAAEIKASGNPDKVVVIGRTMTRVRSAVEALRGEGVTSARWYQAWTNDPFDPDLAMARNTAWIGSKMDQGYSIVDIGPDLSRADPFGPFYGMEKAATSARSYPTIPMDWP
jgi:RHS repeat-associated protein